MRLPALLSAITACCIATCVATGARAQPAAVADGEICQAQMPSAQAEYGLPDGLLLAVSQVESGRNGRPWPWTLNVAGRSFFAEDPDAALREANVAIARGHNVDLGCMQVSWTYHGREFPDPAWALDPRNNVTYAAWFLASLYARFGSWTEAVAHYHASDPDEQRRYLCLVLARLRAADPSCNPGAN